MWPGLLMSFLLGRWSVLLRDTRVLYRLFLALPMIAGHGMNRRCEDVFLTSLGMVTCTSYGICVYSSMARSGPMGDFHMYGYYKIGDIGWSVF